MNLIGTVPIADDLKYVFSGARIGKMVQVDQYVLFVGWDYYLVRI